MADVDAPKDEGRSRIRRALISLAFFCVFFILVIGFVGWLATGPRTSGTASSDDLSHTGAAAAL